MKCICLVHNYTLDTFAGMSYSLAHHLAKNGYNVLFISHQPNFKKPLKIHDYPGFIHVYSWPSKKRPTGLKSFIWFIRLFVKYRPETVIAHFAGSNISVIGSKLMSFWRTRTLVYYHSLSNANTLDIGGDNISSRYKRIRKKIFYGLFSDSIICPSLLAKKDFDKVFAFRKNNGKCKVILNPMVDRHKVTTFAPPKSNEIQISFLGRLDRTKGILELLNGVLSYEQKRKSKVRLNIAGSGSLLKQVHEFITKSTNITYHGHLQYKDVDEYIRKSDFVIIPSLADNLPTVGLESLMNGVPLLLSNQTGLAEFITDGEEGYLFYPTEEGINEVFDRVEANISKIVLMSINARKTYLKKFTMNIYFTAMLKIL